MKIKQKLMLTVFYFFILTSGHSQSSFDCDVDTLTTPNSFILNQICTSSTLNYIPNELTTHKTIKVSVHYMIKDAADPRNFTATDDGLGNTSFTGFDHANTIIGFANQQLSVNYQMNLPIGNSTPVIDRKYSYSLEGVYFHENTNDYTYGLSTGSDLNNTYGIDNTLNIFFVYDENTPVGLEPARGGNSTFYGGWMRQRGAWQTYVLHSNDGFWASASNVNHEIGHFLSLSHTVLLNNGTPGNIDDFCNDTPSKLDIMNSGQPNPDCGFGQGDIITCSNNLMDYTGATIITPEQLGRIHFALINNLSNYIKEDYCNNNQNLNKTILTNTVLDNSEFFYGDIIIEPNVTLTIKCIIYMSKNSRIIVKPGGNLIVNGGKITNGCNELWSGIEVLGVTSDNTQSFSIQGHATFINDALIENAIVAVKNYGTNTDGSINWNSSGGIIQASNTEFLNNRRDVEFLTYQRTWSNGDLVNDRSNFRDVVFKTTDDFRHANTMNHVTMYKTYGIRFTGCDFIDARDANFNSTWINGTNAHNCGIRSVDAKYTVSGKCLSGNISNCNGDLSSGNWEPTTFTNLDFGIYASNASTENNITVDRCEFTNNLYGVELVKSNSPTVTRSHFKYNNSNKYLNAYLDDPDADSPHGYLHGIHALVLSEMRIEENLFINNGAVNNTYGIICSHLGESGEQTYLNRFENLTVASLTQGKNRSVDPNGIYHGIYGLQFLCNKNISNIQDHKVLGTLWSDEDALNYTSNTYGVRSNNGGDNFKSGLEFTQNSASVEDYENFSTNNIKFYYDLNGVNEKPEQISSNVAALPSTLNTSVTCSSNLTSKPIKLLPVLVKSQLISDFNTTSANLVIAKQSYEALLDCGDTDGLMFLIDNLNSNTKSVLRQELLNCSPYVTTDIIKATIDNKETYYPNAWCLELILANIDVVRERNFMQFLTDKTNPMPAWMIQTLNWYVVNGYSLTPKAIKELEISDLSYKRNYASDMIIRDFKNDTTGTNLDSVKFWIEQKADIDAQVRLIDIALQKNDVTTAQAKLNVLNADILNYPTHLQSEIQDVVTFKTEVISILGNTGGLANMTENNHMFMTNMATNSEGIAKVQAQELLCFFFDECVEYSFDIPMKARAMAVDKPTVTKPELNFKLFPNPASDWVTIELPLDVAPVIVTITDLQGKLILNTTVNRPIYIWETDQLPNGVYLINIKTEVGGYDLGTEKVTIQH